ncbi:MAG: hypothetical protein K2Y09_13185 [Nitrosomonas sp.]|nr:hypothetical protein [Nitrosomonas sp.]
MVKFRFFTLFQIVLLLFLSTAIQASEGEAGRYLDYCKTAISFAGPSAPSSTEAMNIGFCLGLMDGLRGVNYFLKKADPSSAFCEPANYNNGDLAKTFVEIATARPELKELRGALAAQITLRSAFPCEK